MASFESIKRMVGWCPIPDQNNYQIVDINSGSLSTFDRTDSPESLPLHLNNIYVAGLGKETIIDKIRHNRSAGTFYRFFVI